MGIKIAIVHDWLVTDAGAEKVLRAILELYPDADIYSLVDFLSEKNRNSIVGDREIQSSFIAKLPFAKRYFRNYLPLFPIAIEQFNLSKYDLIISSSWAFAKGVLRHSNQTHICYCHTPIRYAWDFYYEYTKDLNPIKAFFVKYFLHKIRIWDIASVNRVDYFISNSNFIKNRIKKNYNRDSKVIYPPVDIERFRLCFSKENFYLSASRLVSYKKTKLIVEAFNQMPERELIVIGDGEEFEEIKAIAKSNIKVLGYQPYEVLIDYMQRSKGFVFTSLEDFGIIPIEAMSCGTPVIALNDGGTKESVVDGINGVHFESQSRDDIIDAVIRFEKMEFNYEAISRYALNFSKENFKREFSKYIDKVLLEVD